MAGESQASFSPSVRKKIRNTYQYRCVICLLWIDTTQCAHILDAATPVRFIAKSRWDIIECPNCRALFTKNRVVLSLPIPALKYLEKYVRTTAMKPLHEVFDLLVDALHGRSVALPSLDAIIPYIGLFTLVTLNPTEAARDIMPTPHLPGLSIIRNKIFEEAPANTFTTAKNVARIFDPLDIKEDTPVNWSRVPLASDVANFEEKRYWRIPVFAGVIFAALMARLPYDSSGCEDIVLARKIYGHLLVKSSGGSGPSGGPGGGRGRGRGGGDGSSSGRSGGGRQSKSGEWSDASGEAPRPFPVHLGPYWNVVPPGVRSQYGQSDRLEIASSTRTLGDDMPAIDTNKDNSADSETGRSISAIDPPDEDNPDEWRFGPSFSTNKFVFTVRAVNLIS